MDDSLFEEKQYFRQWWLWLIMLFIVGDMLWQMAKGFMEIGMEPLERVLCDILLPIIPLVIVIFFKMANLHTRITEDGIYVKLFPLHRKFKFYPWAVISKLYIRKYSPITEYGGWGMRGFGSNKALNISGDVGLQLKFTNDSKLLIGTKQAEKLDKVLSGIKGIPFETFTLIK